MPSLAFRTFYHKAPKDAPPGGRRYGLYAKNVPRSVSWRVQVDYLDVLSDDEKLFLARFNEEFHNGSFRKGEKALHSSDALRKECYRAKNAANQDCLETARAMNALIDLDAPVLEQKDEGSWTVTVRNLHRFLADREDDLSSTPKHLNTDEYKALVAEFRKHLPPDNKRAYRETRTSKKALKALRTYLEQHAPQQT